MEQKHIQYTFFFSKFDNDNSSQLIVFTGFCLIYSTNKLYKIETGQTF